MGPGGNLSSSIEHLSEVARLTNGIVLQSELIRSEEQFYAIVSELLKIGDQKLLNALSPVKTKSVSEWLDDFFKNIASTPARKVQDVGKVGKAIQGLTGMVPDVETIKIGVAPDGLVNVKSFRRL